MKQIITISNIETKEYFFTTDHCQDHNLGSSWVPVTAYVPMDVVPRKELPSGRIENKEDYKKVFYNDYKEIQNPDSKFQP